MDAFSRIQKTSRPQTTVAAFAAPGIAPMFISRALSILTITHLSCGYDSSAFKNRTRRIKAACEDPPALPVICVGLSSIDKFKSKYERHVLFVCDSAEKLRHTNLSTLPGKLNAPLSERVKEALLAPWHDDLEIRLDEPSLLDYVDLASKPSILRDMQTVFYKINPYGLRKEVQAAVYNYLAGKIARKAAQQIIDKCSRSSEIKALLNADTTQILCKALRDAKKLPAQQVADTYGIDVFDINFVKASSGKD